jgi:hypothetical protein
VFVLREAAVVRNGFSTAGDACLPSVPPSEAVAMTTTGDSVQFWARLQFILEQAVSGLSAEDRAARIEWCRRHGQHGVSAVPGQGETEYFWGGRLLAVVPHDVFSDEAYMQPLGSTFVTEVPNDARELDDGGGA